MLFANVAAQQTFARNTGLLQPPNNESGGHHRGDPQPTLQSRDARLSDVGRYKEVLCGITGSRRHPEVGTAAKDLALADVDL